MKAKAPELARTRADERRSKPARATQLLDEALREPGDPLPPAVREQMEARFRHDLRSVRIHTGPRAQAAADALGAHALTVEDDVLFAAGRFNPETIEGRMLLAHELAHVLQAARSAEPIEQDPSGRRTADPVAEPIADERSSPGADPPSAAEPLREPPEGEESQRDDSAAEHEARMLAARALAGETDHAARNAGSALHPSPAVARFVRELPLQVSAAPLADPFVEVVAIDFARALEDQGDRPALGLRRRLARLPDPTRAAVVERVQELLPAARRERAAAALTEAALGRVQEDAEPEPDSEDRKPRERDREPAAREVAPAREAGEPETAPTPVSEAAEQAPKSEPGTAEPGAQAGAEAQQPAGPEGLPDTPSEAQAADQEETAPAAARAGAPGPPAAGEAATGVAGGEVNPGPLNELEARVDREGREREEAAAEQEAAAAALESATPDAATAPAENLIEEYAPADAAEPGAAGPQVEADAGGEAARAEPQPEPEAGGAEPAAPASEPEVTGEPAPEAEAEPETDPEPAPSPAEIALAQSPPPAEPGPGPVAPPEIAAEEPQMPVAGGTSGVVAEGAAAGGEIVGAGADAAAPEAAGEPAAPESEPATPGAETAAPDAGGAAEPVDDAPAAAAAGSAATGDCGPDVAGGGGGGAAVEAQPEEEPPAVSGATPDAAMGAVAGLGPVEMGRSLGGVSSAAQRGVGEQRSELAADPPAKDRPSGSPETRPAGAVAASRAGVAGAKPATGSVESVEATGAAPATKPEPLPPAPPLPTQGAAAPAVGGGAKRELTAADAQALAGAINDIPVTDPALELTRGPAPTLRLEGEADPQLAVKQRAQVDEAATAATETGRADAAVPLGEADVYPSVPAERLTAHVGEGGGASAPAESTGVEADEATAIVAREEHAEAPRAAAADARAQMVIERQTHDSKTEEEHSKANAEIEELERANTEEQRVHRSDARDQVRGERQKWRDDQDKAVAKSKTDADVESGHARDEVDKQQTAADRKAAEHVDEGSTKAADARRNAERDARAKRDEAKGESKGVLGWLADQATALFNALKEGVKAIFDAARKVVRAAIDAAQKLASAVIDAARNAIVSVIKLAGAALIAIGDVMLAAFPEARDRYRSAIEGLVDDAVEGVNQLAAALKEGVNKLLDLLGAALEGLLNLLEKAYLAAIDIVGKAVEGAIKAAKAVVDAIGAFAALIADVAANPGQWLSNLGASIIDGLKNHVWKALKCAVKNWFNTKIEELLGMAKAIWALLKKGGIKFAEIGKMVWEAVKAALPGMLIQLAIEKLVALLVPAAAALMLIIDGLKAAWGAASRIIAAFEAFMAFLRAVKSGNAGPQFANAVAAGATALIDFLANFLIARLGKAVKGVGGKLKGIAQKIGGRLSKVGKAIAGGARKAAGAAKKAGKAAAGTARTMAKKVVGAVRNVGGKIAAGAKKAIQAVGKAASKLPGFRHLKAAWTAARKAWATAKKAWQKAKARVKAWRERRRRRAEERRKRREEARRRRQARARQETASGLLAARARRMPMLLFRALIGVLRLRWGWRTLRAEPRGRDRFAVVGGFSPTETVIDFGEQWSIVEVHFQVRGTPTSGAEYEQGVMPYVREGLAPQIAGGMPYEVALPGSPTLGIAADPSHGRRSRMDLVRIRLQRGVRVGGALRRPEGLTEIYGQDPSSRRRRRQLREVHLIEATLITSFRSTDPMTAHKRVQIPHTLLNIRERYGADARITYHIISPRRPAPDMVTEVEGHLRRLGLRNARVVWRVTG